MGSLMSSIREVLGNLDPIPSVWLVWLVILVGAWYFGGLGWLILLGITGSLGGLAVTIHSLFFCRIERDPALAVVRERYARGEIDEDQVESMLRRLES